MPQPSLVHMHKYKGAELLYGNIRTLQKSLPRTPFTVQSFSGKSDSDAPSMR